MSSSKFFNPIKVTLTDVSGVEHNITKTIAAISYFEDIYRPFVSANIAILDSGVNFYGSLPIQGGEKVKIVVENVKKELVEYELCVWNVYNRSAYQNKQVYNLALLSEEALINEGARVTEKFKASPDQIVSNILKNTLGTKKDIFTDSTLLKLNILAPVMVIPDLLTPGTKERIWKKPI